MGTFSIKIADHIIKINSLCDHVETFCRDYKIVGDPEIGITITTKDIDSERTEQRLRSPNLTISDYNLELIVLQRRIAEALLDYNILLFHGAAISYKNESFIFTAKSGIGKSTHMLKWLSKLPSTKEINGDKPFILTGKPPIVYGSPWGGKERIGINTKAPLKSIVLIIRSENNNIEKVKLPSIFPMLCQQIIRPQNEMKARQAIRLLASLGSSVSFYKFYCNNFKDDCFEVAYNALVGEV